MTKCDYRINKESIELLRLLIGKRFNHFYADSAFGGSLCFNDAVFSVDGVNYSFNNDLVPLDYYGNGIEDVGVFSFGTADDTLVEKTIQQERTIRIPVDFEIKEIRIVTEKQSVFKENNQKYETLLTRGVIFVFSDGYELSFEKDVWFSESIRISRGYNVIDTYVAVSEFEDSWTDGYNGKCERTIENIH